MSISAKEASDIVSLLHNKGFVIDSDVRLNVNYKSFGSTIVAEQKFLRALGYKGGPLRTWSTAFKGPPPAYGAYDSTFKVSDEEMLRYSTIVGDAPEYVDLTYGELIKFSLTLDFNCDQCGHGAKLRGQQLFQLIGERSLLNAKGKCTQCGKRGIYISGYSPA